jgi:Flp pilus assembly secretin CpaC
MGGAFHDGAQILPNFSGTSNSKDVEDLPSNPPLYLGSSGTSSPPGQHLTATLQAFERYGVMRILAEPTVTPDDPNFAWARRPIVFGGGQRNSMR